VNKLFFITSILILCNYCSAEPAQIDKSAVVNAVTVNSAIRNGSWILWACGEYKTWNKSPGSLWNGTDTKKENLGAGLCAGFISGVIEIYSHNLCVPKNSLNPYIVLDYLEKHPEFNNKPAGPLVIEAYLEVCK
jgi:hypothetical protein